MAQDRENDQVIGVFPDEEAAAKAAQAVQGAGGEDVRVAASEDEVTALRSEMREEAAEVKPGFFTEEMVRPVVLWTAIVAIAGVLVALPAAFTEAQSVPLTTRLLVAAFFGAAVGATVGFLFAVLGRRWKRKSALAAEQGTVVAATESTGNVTPALAAEDPVRVDKASPRGQPKETVDPAQ